MILVLKYHITKINLNFNYFNVKIMINSKYLLVFLIVKEIYKHTEIGL